MNYFRLIIHLVIVLLFTFSCKTPQEGIKKDIAGKEDSNVIFETGNKRLDQEYIKSGCAVTDSVKNQIADIFSYTDFFHLYLQVSKTYMKYCFSKKGLGIRSGSMQAVNNKRFVNL